MCPPTCCQGACGVVGLGAGGAARRLPLRRWPLRWWRLWGDTRRWSLAQPGCVRWQSLTRLVGSPTPPRPPRYQTDVVPARPHARQEAGACASPPPRAHRGSPSLPNVRKEKPVCSRRSLCGQRAMARTRGVGRLWLGDPLLRPPLYFSFSFPYAPPRASSRRMSTVAVEPGRPASQDHRWPARPPPPPPTSRLGGLPRTVGEAACVFTSAVLPHPLPPLPPRL